MKRQQPLINKLYGRHYDATGTPAICDFERLYTVQELMAWAKISKAKYEHPARATKGQKEADVTKAQTYDDYYKMLKSIAECGPHIVHETAEEAYKIVGYEWEY